MATFLLPSRQPPRSGAMASLRRSQRLLPSSQARPLPISPARRSRSTAASTPRHGYETEEIIMIERRPFAALGGADHGWLKAKHHFSFARYYDPERLGHGALRVWNDD